METKNKNTFDVGIFSFGWEWAVKSSQQLAAENTAMFKDQINLGWQGWHYMGCYYSPYKVVGFPNHCKSCEVGETVLDFLNEEKFW